MSPQEMILTPELLDRFLRVNEEQVKALTMVAESLRSRDQDLNEIRAAGVQTSGALVRTAETLERIEHHIATTAEASTERIEAKIDSAINSRWDRIWLGVLAAAAVVIAAALSVIAVQRRTAIQINPPAAPAPAYPR